MSKLNNGKMSGTDAAASTVSFSKGFPVVRRSRRGATLLSLPLSLFLLYFLLNIQFPYESPTFFSSTPYIDHSGRSALRTEISLPKVQFPFRNGEGADPQRRERVKQAILRTWEGYVSQAWGWDEVK